MNQFNLTITSVGEELFHGYVIELNCKGVAGDMTILPNHEPIITMLRSGDIVVRTEDSEQKFCISGGILEVSNNVATVLCAKINDSDDIQEE